MEHDGEERSRFSFEPVELLVLEDRWNKGKLDEYKPLVRKFINEQQKITKDKLGRHASGGQLARGLIELLLSNGTLDHASENLQQKQEIMKEQWIRGERGDYDGNRIASEWIEKHAPSWRRWRVLVYSFITVKFTVEDFRDLDL